jgi:hypothetical protein
MYFNFGTIEVARINNFTISVTMHIRDLEGKIVVTKTLEVTKEYKIHQISELQCMRRITERREWNFFLTQIESIVKDRSIYLFVHYYWYYSLILTSVLTVIIWTTSKFTARVI